MYQLEINLFFMDSQTKVAKRPSWIVYVILIVLIVLVIILMRSSKKRREEGRLSDDQRNQIIEMLSSKSFDSPDLTPEQKAEVFSALEAKESDGNLTAEQKAQILEKLSPRR